MEALCLQLHMQITVDHCYVQYINSEHIIQHKCGYVAFFLSTYPYVIAIRNDNA